MEKKCLYCEKDLQYQRSSRKYCSDNCKQLAYYKRKGVSLSGVSDDNSGVTVNPVESEIHSNRVKQEAVTVKEPDNVKANGFTINYTPEEQSIAVNDSNTNGLDKNTVKENVAVKQEGNNTVKNVLPEYEWEESELITQIEDWICREKQIQEIFECPQNYWAGDTLSIVRWVTMVLRCLIESIIQLSNRPHIDNHTLFEVEDAFNRLVDSYCYEFLPNNYPYKNLIKELQQKMNAMTHANKQNEKVRFRISLDRKAKLIATRFIIGEFVPKIKFSELEFSIRK